LWILEPARAETKSPSYSTTAWPRNGPIGFWRSAWFLGWHRCGAG
jgi:hypothetical protein